MRNRQWHIAAQPIIAAKRATLADLWRHPDKLGLHVIGRRSIFPQNTAIGRINEPAGVRSCTQRAPRSRHPFVRAVIDMGEHRFSAAAVTDQPCVAIISGAYTDAAGAGFLGEIALSYLVVVTRDTVIPRDNVILNENAGHTRAFVELQQVRGHIGVVSMELIEIGIPFANAKIPLDSFLYYRWRRYTAIPQCFGF